MKLFVVALAAWIAGIVAHLLPPVVLWQERFGAEDLLGIILMSAAYSLIIFFLIYVPGLFWLRRRLGGCAPAAYFPLAACLLNIPVAVLIILLHKFGGAFSTGEAVLFMIQFLVAGLVFAMGFIKVYKDRPVHKTATDFA